MRLILTKNNDNNREVMEQIDLFSPLPLNKKVINLQCMSRLLHQLNNEWNHLPLPKKAIVSQIARYFLISTTNLYYDIHKFRQETCSSAATRQTNTKGTVSHVKKRKEKNNRGANQDDKELSLQ